MNADTLLSALSPLGILNAYEIDGKTCILLKYHIFMLFFSDNHERYYRGFEHEYFNTAVVHERSDAIYFSLTNLPQVVVNTLLPCPYDWM